MKAFHGSSQILEIYYGDIPVNQIFYRNEPVWLRSFTLTIVPATSDATVTLTSPGCIQSGNSIVVQYGASVFYSVSKLGYVTRSGTEIITSNKTVNVPELEIDYVFPTVYSRPTSVSSETLVDSVSGNTYKTGTINTAGWYKITTRGETGGGQWSSAAGGATGGCVISDYVYLYSGSKYLIWGATNRYTGYPTPSTVLGGNGGQVTWTEAGGGGGGAGNHGGHVHSDGGWGGGGTGCIIGIDKTKSDGTTLTESWNHAGFSVQSVECMILAGGGGGNSGDNGEPRPGGAGGGAWGNGGNNSYANGSSGPGGTSFGCGASNPGYWAGPGAGAWCVRDYSTSTWSSGTGVKSGSSGARGTTYIYKINV